MKHKFSLCTTTSHSLFFFFNDTATTEIYTLSLHDALPIWGMVKLTPEQQELFARARPAAFAPVKGGWGRGGATRSEEHTSELQSQSNLVCRLLLEKKKNSNPIGQ